MIRRLFPLFVILLSLVATAEIAGRVYDRLPHLEDELAYLFQARVFASGQLYAATPQIEPLAFGIPFVIDLNGKRFSKYPPGGSLTLALGELLGDVWIINSLLGAMALAITFRLGRDLYNETTGLIAVAIGAASPFYLILTSSLMAHSASMLAAGLFALTFFRARQHPARLPSVIAGFALGLEFLIRPYTALWTAVPFAIIVGNDAQRDRRNIARYIPMAAAFAITASLLPLYNFIITGQPRLSLYDLWWSFDRIGFGPAVGPNGFTLIDAVSKTLSDLTVLTHDLHGVPFLSLTPLALGVLLSPRSRTDAFLAAAPLSLLFGAFFYHSGSRLYGPRYVYEAWPAMMLLSARGLLKLWQAAAQPRIARWFAATVMGLFFGVAIFFYLPFRLTLLRHVYDDALNWQVAQTTRAADIHNAIVFLFADDWPQAAAGTILTDPNLRADVLYPRYLSPDSYRAIVNAYPNRRAYFWRDGILTPATNPPPQWQPVYPTVRYPNP